MITVDLVKVKVPICVLLIKGVPETLLLICGVIEKLGVKEPIGVAEEVFVPSVDLVYVGEPVEVFDTKELKVLVGL